MLSEAKGKMASHIQKPAKLAVETYFNAGGGKAPSTVAESSRLT